MKQESTAATYPICRYIDYWLTEGCSEESLRCALGEYYDQLSNNTIRIPASKVANLFRAVDAELKDPLIGLKSGVFHIPSYLGVIGTLMTASKNIRMAVLGSVQFLDILSTSYERAYYETQAGGTFLLAPKAGIDISTYQLEAILSTYIRLILFITGKHDGILYFTHTPEPNIQKMYRQLLGIDIYFGHSFNGVYFNNKILNSRISIMNNANHEEQIRVAKTQAQSIQGVSSMVELLRQHYRNTQHMGKTNIDTLAEQFFISTRTLQNQLKEEGLTYSILIQEEKIKKINGMILNLTDSRGIAASVGYSDVSTFYRAFKGWTGQSFQQYKESCFL